VGGLAVIGIALIVFSSGALSSVFATPTASPTFTQPPTLTATPTATETAVPTNTPLPPQPYSVVAGDTCISIALTHNVSVQSILDLNKLPAGCILSIGQVLQIPQPTPTPTALPTATLSPEQATQTPRTTYTVHAGDTCGGIANFYHIQVADLMGVNGITDCALLRQGQVLIIPLELAITPGPSPTATPYPPYPAPNQLVPADGQTFAGGEVITLQWASLGVLRNGEAYYVTVEDVTCNCAAVRKFATTETKLIVPADLRPTDGKPHIFRWSVMAVRANGTSAAGQPVYDTAGAASSNRVFSWQ
jgi:LysM repeat protein